MNVRPSRIYSGFFINMKKYIFKNYAGIYQTFTAKTQMQAKEMAFNYFKTNLIDLVC